MTVFFIENTLCQHVTIVRRFLSITLERNLDQSRSLDDKRIRIDVVPFRMSPELQFFG